jgi:hypothetical protein
MIRQRVSAMEGTLVAASRNADSISNSKREKLFPNLAPILLTSPLAFELLSPSAHASATFRTDPIRNAGDYFRSCFEGAQSEICHVTLRCRTFNDPHQRFRSGERTLRFRSLETNRGRPRRLSHFLFQNDE